MSGAKSVLVVDDEQDIREAVELALSLEGFAVAAAPDRDTALRMIEADRPKLVLLDYRMPGLSAREFLEILRERNIDTAVVLMTATRDPGEQARELGVCGCLPKPFELDDLLKLAQRYSA